MAAGVVAQKTCVLCGASEHRLLYPATHPDPAEAAYYACTSAALADHDDIVRCTSCGLVSANPRVDPDTILEHYGNVVDETYFDEEASRRRFFRWVLDRLGAVSSPGRLLEVGSHVGMFLAQAREDGWTVTGIEPSRWAVQQAKERFGLDLLPTSLESYEAEPATFDVVVMFDVLEHLIDPVASLRKMHGFLAPGGLLVVSTVNLSGFHARVRRGRWPWFIRPHLFYFSRETLERTLRSAGFEVIQRKAPPRPLHLSYVARRLASSQRGLSRLLLSLSRVFDPSLPFGWLGDIVFVIARRTDG